MRIAPVVPSKDIETLQRQLTVLQNSINDALSKLGFDYAAKLGVTCEPTAVPFSIRVDMPKAVWGLHLVYVRNITDDTAIPTSDVFVDWISSEGGVTIRNINGLTPTHLYELRFLAYA